MARRRRRTSDLDRSRRRARRTLLVVGVVIVVLLAVALVGQTERQSRPYDRSVDLGFSALMAPLASQSAGTGQALATLLAKAPGDSRPVLLAGMAALSAEAAKTASAAGAAVPPVPPPPAGTLCEQAFTLRRQAADALLHAVDDALGGYSGVGAAPEAVVARSMATAASEVRSADAHWASCRRSLRRAPGHARLPASRWVTSSDTWSAATMAAEASAIAASASLAPAPGLAITGVHTTPPALAVSGGSTYQLTAADTLGVQVIVSDTGNVDLRHVTVTAAAKGTSTSSASSSLRAVVDVPAQGATTVTLHGLRVTPGSTYQLVVDAATGGVPRGEGRQPSLAAVAPADIVPVALAQAATSGSVAVSANPAHVGQPVVYTATITGSLPGAGLPVGTVAFEDAGTTIPQCAARPLRQAVATCTVTYRSPGLHSIAVVYAGTAALAGSTSPAITETVTAAPPRHR